MSKGAKIAIIIGVILVIAMAAIFGFGVISLNKEKTPMTASQFKTIMEQKGYLVTDASYQFLEYDDYVRQVYVAGDNNYSYQIEFYELSDESTATGFYNNNASIFQSRKASSSAETNVNGKNFSKYTLSSGGKYMVVSRIDNTVIYLDVDSSYKDEVKKIVDELGY